MMSAIIAGRIAALRDFQARFPIVVFSAVLSHFAKRTICL
jgi:hypothetical protein